MIRRPAGWTYERRPDRFLLANDDLGGRLRYFERLQPLERLGDLLERHEPLLRATALRRVERPEPIVTLEGEYGVIVRFTGSRGARNVAWSLAFVFGDDFYSHLEGVAHSEHAERLHATVREVIATEELGLGIRRRRFVFRPPPPPWQAITLGYSIAHYFPETYPLLDARISVYPAVPMSIRNQPVLDLQRTMGEHILVDTPGSPTTFEIVAPPEPSPFETTSGLEGTRWYATGHVQGRGQVVRDIVVVRDEVYVYACELSARAEHRDPMVDVFLEVARSLQPLPRCSGPPIDTSTFSHWVE